MLFASLFPEIPIGESNCLDDRKQINGISTGVNSDNLGWRFFFYTRNFQFKSGEQICRQRDSVDVGSPMGPLIGTIFLIELGDRPVYYSYTGFPV